VTGTRGVLVAAGLALAAAGCGEDDEARGGLTREAAEREVRRLEEPQTVPGGPACSPEGRLEEVRCRPAPVGWSCSWRRRDGETGTTTVGDGAPQIVVVC
jgi:hypothetical protein